MIEKHLFLNVLIWKVGFLINKFEGENISQFSNGIFHSKGNGIYLIRKKIFLWNNNFWCGYGHVNIPYFRNNTHWPENYLYKMVSRGINIQYKFNLGFPNIRFFRSDMILKNNWGIIRYFNGVMMLWTQGSFTEIEHPLCGFCVGPLHLKWIVLYRTTKPEMSGNI